MKSRTFTVQGFCNYDLQDMVRTQYDIYTDTTTVIINPDVLGLFVKIMSEVDNEIEKNDLENL